MKTEREIKEVLQAIDALIATAARANKPTGFLMAQRDGILWASTGEVHSGMATVLRVVEALKGEMN